MKRTKSKLQGELFNEVLWTVQKVKTDLPKVTVQMGKEIFAAETSGRLNEWCTVEIMPHLNSKPIAYRRLYYEWGYVVMCLIQGTALDEKDQIGKQKKKAAKA